MTLRYLTIGLAISAVITAANAQTPLSCSQKNLLFVPSTEASVASKQSYSPFLESVQASERFQPVQRGTAATQKECPMPVHRRDTSRLERMRVARPSPSASYPMPVAERKCFNPLDQPK
jgi:hypothetical protein